MPPPRVRPPIPVVEMIPPVVASPKACVAWLKSPQVAPPSARAVLFFWSTRTPFMSDRSMTQTTVVRAKPRHTVPSAPHGQIEIGLASEVDGRDHIGHTRGAYHAERALIDHRVVDAARLVVAGSSDVMTSPRTSSRRLIDSWLSHSDLPSRPSDTLSPLRRQSNGVRDRLTDAKDPSWIEFDPVQLCVTCLTRPIFGGTVVLTIRLISVRKSSWRRSCSDCSNRRAKARGSTTSPAATSATASCAAWSPPASGASPPTPPSSPRRSADRPTTTTSSAAHRRGRERHRRLLGDGHRRHRGSAGTAAPGL